MCSRVGMSKDELIDELMELEENETEHLGQYVSLLKKIYEKIKHSRGELRQTKIANPSPKQILKRLKTLLG